MRIELRRAFAAARPLPRLGTDALPPQLGFLGAFGIPAAPLQAAVVRATAEGVSPLQALFASGTVSQTCYYSCLARHLGCPFRVDWPRLRFPLDMRDALTRGLVRLDGDSVRWLLAPTDDDIERLLKARERGAVPAGTAITTPSHLGCLLCHRAGAEIAHRASHALPEDRPRHSALGALSTAALVAIGTMFLVLVAGAWSGWHLQAQVLGIVFLAGLVFRLIACAEGLSERATANDPPLPEAALPSYSILVPLKEEAGMVPGLLLALDAIDYPRAKREVLLLIEADDTATRAALARPLPPGFAVVEVPPGEPRTKPRALNVGLILARGEIVTVFDAEDRPDPDQLRRAAARFESRAAPANLACLQARLAIGGGTNLLGSLFAIEYGLLFEVFNRGLTRWRLPLALGGTSNHFKTDVLRAVGGWDAWNVTEDADLGLRLARFGYASEMLDSVTWEEAPARIGGWLKQRRRWTKGWLQTLLVLGRDLPAVLRELGPRRTLVVGLLLTNLVTGPLLTPLFLVSVIVGLAHHGLPTPSGLSAHAEATLVYAVIVIGGLGTLWSGLVGARACGMAERRPVAAFPIYQLAIAVAAWGGLIDLVWRPYHWHKTAHGEAARVPSRRWTSRMRLRRPGRLDPPIVRSQTVGAVRDGG